MPEDDDRVPPMAVLDASVAVRWVVTERGSDEAAELLGRPVGWLAPRLMLIEAAGALRKKVAVHELDTAAAAEALDILVHGTEDGLIHLAEDETLVASSLLLAIRLKHRVPDCVYLALAEREGAALATADARLASIAKARGVEVWRVHAA